MTTDGLIWEYAVLNFRSLEDLNLAIVKKLHTIRSLNVDLIVGIPRSGMIPASLIATHLQLPFTDVDSYNSNRWYVRNKKITVPSDIPNNPLRILLVDDTINTGNAMRDVVKSLKKSNDIIIKFAVYGSPKNKIEDIDFVCEECPLPRAFQWNLWKHTQASNWATDMDGVLCRDPSKKENDKGPRLENFYKTAQSKFLFSKPIKYIITSREERFRKVTETWLASHHIKYEKLIMKPSGSLGGNQANAEYKTSILNSIDKIELYIESDVEQAKIISQNTGIPTWCIDNQKLY
jgi:hypoxanthine phosphoribosyltransferase